VKEGLRIAQDELHEILEQHGVAVVNAVGGAFDPSFHEAVGAEETNDVKEGTVLSEIQRGYLLNGRLLRPSRVKIAKKEEKT
jgi:molecular chaperone GrpE